MTADRDDVERSLFDAWWSRNNFGSHHESSMWIAWLARSEPPHARAQAGEPVAWQYRIRAVASPGGEWGEWRDGRAPTFRGSSYEAEERPLYTLPAPTQEPVAVPAGFVLVSKRVTPEIKAAMKRCEAGELSMTEAWSALLDASPTPTLGGEEVANPDWLPFAAQWGGYALLLHARRLCEEIEKLPGGLDQSAMIDRASEVAFALQQFQMRGKYHWRPIAAPVSPPAESGDDDAEHCIACDEPLKDGDLVYPDVSGGHIHDECADDGGVATKDRPEPQVWPLASTPTPPQPEDFAKGAEAMREACAHRAHYHASLCGEPAMVRLAQRIEADIRAARTPSVDGGDDR